MSELIERIKNRIDSECRAIPVMRGDATVGVERHDHFVDRTLAIIDEESAKEPQITGNCKGCKHDTEEYQEECMHCMRAFSDCYESVEVSE